MTTGDWLLLFPAVVGLAYYIGWSVGWRQGRKASNQDSVSSASNPAKRPS